MVYIYALVDPFTNKIRYIGKSIRPTGRLSDHCNDRSKTWRTNWIQEVIQKGGRPQLTILEALPQNDGWEKAEIRWIAKGRSLGWPLTNCTSGGDGVPDLPAEIRKKISAAWLGRKHTPEELKKMGDSSRGRKKTGEMKEFMRSKMAGRKITWGEKISRATSKLTDDQVIEIKIQMDRGVSQYKIAAAFGVHQGTISNIKRGLCYQWLNQATAGTLFASVPSE